MEFVELDAESASSESPEEIFLQEWRRQLFALAIEEDVSLSDLSQFMHVYPTLSTSTGQVAGEAAFQRLRGAAAAFDKQLRAGFSDDEVTDLEALLSRLAANVT